jgi:hypothetical protein
VQALTDAMADRYRALITLAAGTGMRQDGRSGSAWTASTSCAGN